MLGEIGNGSDFAILQEHQQACVQAGIKLWVPPKDRIPQRDVVDSLSGYRYQAMWDSIQLATAEDTIRDSREIVRP